MEGSCIGLHKTYIFQWSKYSNIAAIMYTFELVYDNSLVFQY